MKFIISDTIALRSWQKIPHAYYEKNQKYASLLTKAEFLMLLQCNGRNDLTVNDVLQSLLDRKLCRAANDGEELNDWQKLKIYDNRYFPRMFWSITDRCSSNCSYCYNAAGIEKPMHEFSWEESRKLIHEAADCGVQRIKLSGGEPFLHPHFLKILKEINNCGMNVDRIYSSGENMTQELLDAVKQFHPYAVMKISFDGLGMHDYMHQRKGAEKEALAAIDRCHKNDMHVQVVMNINRLNQKTLLPTALYFAEKGIDALQVLRTTESPRWKQCAMNESLSPQEYYDFLIKFTADYLKKGKQMPVEIWKFLNLIPSQMKEFAKSPDNSSADKDFEKELVCGDNREMVSIAADGELYPCITMTGLFRERGISFGNVIKDGLAVHLRDGAYMTELCRTVGDLKKADPECACCPHLPACGGGCPAISLAQTGDLHRHNSVQCLYYRGNYQALLKETISACRNVYKP